MISNSAGAGDVFVAQFQVPVGFVTQLRFFPQAVRLHLKDGRSVELDPDSSDLPSWRNSGWKFVPQGGTPLPISEDELTGARALLAFEDRLVRLGSGKTADRWKMKPTLPVESFLVNPPQGEPGIFFDQLTVVFREGIPPARILEISSRIGARVLITPLIGSWYRFKLPASTNAEEASRYFLAQPEVSGVMPAIDFALDLTPDDNANPIQHDLVEMAAAWDIAAAAGTIGKSTIVASVIEGGFDLGHVDLYRNVWVNQG